MILSKIKKDIFQRSKLQNNVGLMQHNSTQEYEYRFCTCEIPELENYYFVVSKYFKYKGNSMDDFGFNVYVYDKDGNFVEDPKVYEKCRGRFFDSIKDME
jgi:hypothetical protein